MLARTQERVGVGERLAGLVDGTSDWARLGVSVVLAHQVSPGYGMPDGTPLTLEIVSRLSYDVLLRPGTRIANLMLLRGRRVRQSYRDMPAHHSSAEWSVGSRLAESLRAATPASPRDPGVPYLPGDDRRPAHACEVVTIDAGE